ncbi:RNA polymerase sigma factor [Paenibacillus oceani]|uniref:RNA polymerase sigma factor n=1 Tax=Paenibacillus oceani TaxID=2772510 RepID=UPI0021DF804C|nr:sigma factor-like helix-turn-helix DNA-binding protein [Paenibacillus oceani]
MDKKYRIPIHLHDYEGYSIQEIAAIMQAKSATVGTWLARGRLLLREKIGGLEDEEICL